MAWQADSLNAVVFFGPHVNMDALQPWIAVFGRSPDTFQQLAIGAAPGSTATGIVGDYQITITSQPARLDISLASAKLAEQPLEQIENIDAGLTVLVGYASKLISSDVAIRLAITTSLAQKTKDARDATTLFKESVPIIVPDNAQDLTYTLNIRKKISDNRSINRLCRWGTGSTQLLNMQVVAISDQPVMKVTEVYAAYCVFDVNTVADGNLRLDKDKAASVFAELVAEARALISDGYAYLVG